MTFVTCDTMALGLLAAHDDVKAPFGETTIGSEDISVVSKRKDK